MSIVLFTESLFSWLQGQGQGGRANWTEVSQTTGEAVYQKVSSLCETPLHKLLKAKAFRLILLQGPSFRRGGKTFICHCQASKFLSGLLIVVPFCCVRTHQLANVTSVLEIDFRDIKRSSLLCTACCVKCPSKSDGAQVKLFDRAQSIQMFL